MAQAPVGEKLSTAAAAEVKNYGPDGRLESVLYTSPEFGLWKESFVRGSEGLPVIRHFAAVGTGTEVLAAHLKDLGLAPGVTPASRDGAVKAVAGGTLFTAENGFARTETFYPTGWREPPGPDGKMWKRQRTEVMGASLTAEGFKYPDGRFEVTDDFGGWRIVRYEIQDEKHYLVEAADSHGSLVRIRRDERGRISRALLVNRYELRYSYDGASPDWIRKTLVDLVKNRTLARITAQNAARRVNLPGIDSSIPPHPRTTAHMVGVAGGPMVAEWDDRSGPGGTAIAAFGDEPYALMPFEGGPTSARVLQFHNKYPVYLHGAMSYVTERLDYTETHARIWLQTDLANGLGEARTQVLELTRKEQAPPVNGWQDAPEDGGFPYLPGSNGGNDGGGGGGGGGDGTPGNGNPIPPDQQFSLNQAHSLALDKVESVESCGDLFNGLNETNGADMLHMTEYREWESNDACNGSVAAFTHIGSREVYLCNLFFGLSRTVQAATLIHEALHSAGMPEDPPVAGALSTTQIQQMVNQQCGF